MPLTIMHGDITTLACDGIVNAANPALQLGGGVCGAIFRAAGPDELEAACRAIGGCRTGEAVITKGFALPASYVIHTVGPVWHGGTHGEAELLRACYLNSMTLALENKLASLAFPLLSAGIYGYPKDLAYRIAVETITDFLESKELSVFLVLFEP